MKITSFEAWRISFAFLVWYSDWAYKVRSRLTSFEKVHYNICDVIAVKSYLCVPSSLNSDEWSSVKFSYYSENFSFSWAWFSMDQNIRWPHMLSQLRSNLSHPVLSSYCLGNSLFSSILRDYELIEFFYQLRRSPFFSHIFFHLLLDSIWFFIGKFRWLEKCWQILLSWRKLIKCFSWVFRKCWRLCFKMQFRFQVSRILHNWSSLRGEKSFH